MDSESGKENRMDITSEKENNMDSAKDQSRRQFLTRSALSTAAVTGFPLIIPRRALASPGRLGANDRIAVGVIGVGGRGNLLIDQLPEPGHVVALADCELGRCEAAAAKRGTKWDVYQDYRRILDRKDIDAVIVATTDHGRVLPAIHACQAGKDVYAEKPLTLNIGEGRALVKAARQYERVFQVGTQQRSMEMNQIACRLVRTGGLGALKLVQGVDYPSATPLPAGMADEPVPDTMNWDVWLGQTKMRPYNKLIHRGWMGWSDFSGGEMTNWGAHGLDQIQWAVGMDRTGPVELWPMEETSAGPYAKWPGGGVFGAIGFRYANGLKVHLDLPTPTDLVGGGRFFGEKGQIDIWRNNFKIDAPGVTLDLPPQEEIEKWHDKRALWQAQYHMKFWLDCIPTRERPNADVEIGHRSVSLCHLVNITRKLQRKLRWDPEAEQFLSDREANLLVDPERRRGYELPKV
jgi:predicted dehydrogenase